MFGVSCGCMVGSSQQPRSCNILEKCNYNTSQLASQSEYATSWIKINFDAQTKIWHSGLVSFLCSLGFRRACVNRFGAPRSAFSVVSRLSAFVRKVKNLHWW